MTTNPPRTIVVDPKRELIKTLTHLAQSRHAWEVFRDFAEISALTISNAVDSPQREAREARYLEIIKPYRREQLDGFARALALVVEMMEAGFCDCLGEVFMSMDLGSHWHGQYLTPIPVCQMMAQMTAGDAASRINAQGFVTVLEPAAGSGAMVLALAEAIHTQGANYQRGMHVRAVDIESTAVHMCYVQLSLMHVPAIVQHGDTLRACTWATWYTPAHVLGGWTARLRRRDEFTRPPHGEPPTPTIRLPSPERRAPTSDTDDQLTLF